MNYSNTGSGSTFNQFTTNKYINSTKEFLESNSLVAKVSFLLLVFLLFVIFNPYLVLMFLRLFKINVLF